MVCGAARTYSELRHMPRGSQQSLQYKIIDPAGVACCGSMTSWRNGPGATPVTLGTTRGQVLCTRPLPDW